ncbi:MAG: o-succinylbenzoate synthase [Actinomycetota bacterium]
MSDALTGVRFRIPLRVPFRGVTAREGTIVQGPSGAGESSAFPAMGLDDKDNSDAAAHEAATRPWPERVRDVVPVHATIPAVSADEAWKLTKAARCRTAKVKVAEGDDEARLEAVADALGPGGRLRIDANGAWDVEMAVRQIRRFSRYGLELVEQPVASIEEMAELRARVEVPVAADEIARTPEGAQRTALFGAADAIVVKVQSFGGVWPSLRAIESAGLPAIVSSPLETSVGLAAGVALAAALPELPYACGLWTLPLLEGDVVADPFVPIDGTLHVRRPRVDPALLKRYEVTGA